jgi:hypothetical protein
MVADFEHEVDALLRKLTPEFLEGETWKLLRNFPDMDGGIDAFRLVRHLLDQPDLNDIQTGWAYQKIRPVFNTLFEHIPSLYFFTGD